LSKNEIFNATKVFNKFVISLFFRQEVENMVQNNDFSLLIQNWYRQNARNLPWRDTKSPYYIWLSEIILQQTRVNQGLSYFHKFVELFPTVNDLANASEQQVLSAWQGLGYYSRARNLHKAAKIVVEDYKGEFPKEFKLLLQLPGVGTYTASAIASFAFDLPHAVVDGNVYRLLSRYFDIDIPIDSTEGKRYFEELATTLLDRKNPAIHNQAMMEMGAIICMPNLPKCDDCPLNTSCSGLQNKTLLSLPVKAKKTKVRDRFFHFLVAIQDDKILLQKRTEKDIWQNMYQFPLIEMTDSIGFNEENLPDNFELNAQEPIVEYKHILSHQKIKAQFHKTVFHSSSLKNDMIWVSRNDLANYPLPRLIDRYLSEIEE